MSFFKKLFGGSKKEQEVLKGIEEHLDYLNTLRKPAIALRKSEVKTFSRIGGLPELPEDVPRPEWKGELQTLLCQLDLSEIPGECDRNGLPASGILYFFYSYGEASQGSDHNEKGSWQVIYTSKTSKDCIQRDIPKYQHDFGYFSEKYLTLTPIETYPDRQDGRVKSLEQYSQDDFKSTLT